LVVAGGGRQGGVLGLESYKFGLEVVNTPLQPSHLGDHTRVYSTDVSEKRLRH
jgi:hypothetical protein